MREKIGAFKNLLGINGHPRGQRRGQKRASMPPGTFMGPPNALTSQQSQARSLSLGAEEASVGPESPMGAEPPMGSEPLVDPALLGPNGDGSQSPGISPEDSRWFLAEFEANLPHHLRGWLGAREPGVPYLAPHQDLLQPETPQRPVPLVPSSLTPSPLPAPPGTCDPRFIMLSSSPEGDNVLIPSSSPEQHDALIEAQNFIEQTDYDDINNLFELGDLHDSNDFFQFPS